MNIYELIKCDMWQIFWCWRSVFVTDVFITSVVLYKHTTPSSLKEILVSRKRPVCVCVMAEDVFR